MPAQPWCEELSALVFMTGLFAREQWCYKTPRAYRTVLVDAGHLGQTFCLVATRLGLAPWTSMALADSRIERDLELDGITESVLYAAGVGARTTELGEGRFEDAVARPRKPATRPAARRRRRRG